MTVSPRADLGDAAIPGDSDAVDAVARRLGDVADQVGHVRSDITRVRHVDGWSGDASNAFRDTLGELPAELTKVETSYSQASSALREYATDLRDLKARSAAVALAIGEAEAEVAHKQALREQTRGALVSARRSRDASVDPITAAGNQSAVEAAQRDFASAGAARDAARGKVQQLRNQASGLHAEWEGVVEVCRTAVINASHAGIRNTFWNGVAQSDAGLTVAALGGGFVRIGSNIREFPEAIGRLIENPSWDAAREVLDKFGDVLMVAGIVLLGALAIAGTGGLAAWLLVGLAAVQVGQVGTSLGVLAIDAGTGKSKRVLAGDALGVALAALPGARFAMSPAGRAAPTVFRQGARSVLGNYQFKSWATRNANAVVPTIIHDAGGDAALNIVIESTQNAAQATYFEPVTDSRSSAAPRCDGAPAGMRFVHAVPGELAVAPPAATTTLRVEPSRISPWLVVQ